MSLFNFDQSHLLGKVRSVDTRKVSILVNSDEDLRKARVGQFVALKCTGATDSWLIGMVEKVIKSVSTTEAELDGDVADNLVSGISETVINNVALILVGVIKWDPISNNHKFSRSLSQVPDIDADCNVLVQKELEAFMKCISDLEKGNQSFEIGKYTIDSSATAYIDGNKLFQRHAALLGSTGCGKSWTVASILEKAKDLNTSNIVVFDLHGEYNELTYARHLKVPGPEELGTTAEQLLYLPYWLLNAEEMQTMFLEASEFSAHNQVNVFQNIVIEEKKKVLESLKKTNVLNAFTIDSPIPFPIQNLLTELERLNTEMKPGAKSAPIKGDYNGHFNRLIPRIKNRLSDKRYGFLFQAPESENNYSSMATMMKKLMDDSKDNAHIKIIDFSEVPAEVLPVIVGLVARIIYYVQFWTDKKERKPIAFVCDEAHLYLPKKDGKNPIEQRAIESFEKIAKEGRKYGVALLIVSQRPSDVSPTVLSQCNNVISLRLTNGEDQATVRKLMPESLESLLDALPIMDTGEALIVGDAVLLPSRILITPPNEKPKSATVDFWTEWQRTDLSPTDFNKSVENMRKQGRG